MLSYTDCTFEPFAYLSYAYRLWQNFCNLRMTLFLTLELSILAGMFS